MAVIGREKICCCCWPAGRTLKSALLEHGSSAAAAIAGDLSFFLSLSLSLSLFAPDGCFPVLNLRSEGRRGETFFSVLNGRCLLHILLATYVLLSLRMSGPAAAAARCVPVRLQGDTSSGPTSYDEGKGTSMEREREREREREKDWIRKKKGGRKNQLQRWVVVGRSGSSDFLSCFGVSWAAKFSKRGE
jgi:hypothetical protein